MLVLKLVAKSTSIWCHIREDEAYCQLMKEGRKWKHQFVLCLGSTWKKRKYLDIKRANWSFRPNYLVSKSCRNISKFISDFVEEFWVQIWHRIAEAVREVKHKYPQTTYFPYWNVFPLRWESFNEVEDDCKMAYLTDEAISPFPLCS